MKLGVMQPYFFPYIGYWQLINAVDKYVIYNDVNYINRGWINRNRILCRGEPLYINIPLNKASQNKKINEIDILQDQRHMTKLLRTLWNCYKAAPYFQEAFSFVSDELLGNSEKRLDLYLFHSLRSVCEYLQIDTPLILSSDLPKNNELRGEAKIIDICRIFGADQYYNAIGGRELYCREHFRQEEVELFFLETKPIVYRQFHNTFIENLSILDMMMFCSREEIREYLNSYNLFFE